MAARLPDGLRLLPEALDRAGQQALLAEVMTCLAAAPPFQPVMPRTGQPFSVRMSNAGPLGWVSDQAGGYRYQAHHPLTGMPWPAIPDSLLALWQRCCDWPDPPEACLINLYSGQARMACMWMAMKRHGGPGAVGLAGRNSPVPDRGAQAD